jgi:hypothetical protein
MAKLPFLLDSEDGGSMYSRNVDNITYLRTVQRPKSTISTNCIYQTLYDGILIGLGYNGFCVRDDELSGQDT